jgi:hypothetical protein
MVFAINGSSVSSNLLSSNETGKRSASRCTCTSADSHRSPLPRQLPLSPMSFFQRWSSRKEIPYCSPWKEVALFWKGLSVLGTSSETGGSTVPRPCDADIVLSIIRGARKAGVEFHQDGKRLGVSIGVRKLAKYSSIARIGLLSATVGARQAYRCRPTFPASLAS